LNRTHPQREIPGRVFDQNAEKPLNRPENGPMHHDGAFLKSKGKPMGKEGEKERVTSFAAEGKKRRGERGRRDDL
jgi:hypothetical protein